MPTHRLSANWKRYEIKYLIDESLAARIRSLCVSHLPVDAFSVTQLSGQYPILSTYLDSSDFQLLGQTLSRASQRVKLRVRTYRNPGESSADGKTFFEIKRKSHGIIYKTRACVPADLGLPLLWDHRPPELSSPRIDDLTHANLDAFLDLQRRVRARPTVGVFYLREAFEENGINRVRITFDRSLHYGLFSRDDPRREVWWPVNTTGVIMEIKFTDSYPSWIADLIHRRELQRCGICKYAICTQSAGITVGLPMDRSWCEAY